MQERKNNIFELVVKKGFICLEINIMNQQIIWWRNLGCHTSLLNVCYMNQITLEALIETNENYCIGVE